MSAKKPSGKKIHKTSLPGLSIVIPCYNEKDRIGATIKSLKNFAQKWTSDLELIFVNDGSSDNTSKVIQDQLDKYNLKDLAKLIELESNKGKGYALKEGVEEASQEWVLTMDADNAVDASTLFKWLKSVNGPLDKNTIYIASRELEESKVSNTFFRRIAGLIYNSIIQWFTAINFKDSQCGFKLYHRSVARDLFSHLSSFGWAHDVELLDRAIVHGKSIKPMPVEWKNIEGSKINMFSDSLKMFYQAVVIGAKSKWRFFVTEAITNFRRDSQARYRFLFFLVFLIALVVMPLLSLDYGVTGDEEVQKNYGDKALAYYESMGEDKSCLSYKNLYYYGAFFEVLTSAATKYLFSEKIDPYTVRHFINALFGVLLILFTGRLAYKVSDSWKIAFWALLFCFLYPRLFGHAMNNPKDIPFACFFTMGLIYIVSLFKEFPRISVKTIIGFIIAFGLAFGIRVGAVLLVPFLGLFGLVALIWHRKEMTVKSFLKALRNGIVMVLGGYLLGIVFWPYALQSPLDNPLIAFGEMGNFSTGIRMLYNDFHYWSDNLPWYYLPHWIFMASTVVVIMGFLLSILSLVWWQGKNRVLLALLFFVLIFPPAYAILSDASYYDGIRHFLFIIPVLIVLSSIGWMTRDHWLPKNMKWVKETVMSILLILPLYWMIRSHPNQYIYFNEFTGGISENYGYNEMDYWMNSMKETCNWWLENEFPKHKSDSVVVVSTNAYIPVAHYLKRASDNIKIRYTSYAERTKVNSDYEIFFVRFVNRELLQNGYYPPAQSLYINKIDDAILSSVTLRLNGKEEKSGSDALQEKRFQEAERFYINALENNRKDEELWTQLAYTYLQSNQDEKFMASVDTVQDMTESHPSISYFLGSYYLRKNQSEKSKQWFEKTIYYNSKLTIANYYLAGIYARENNWQKVFENIVDFEKGGGGSVTQAYNLGIQAAEQLGERAYLAFFKAKKAVIEKDFNAVFQNLKLAVRLDPGLERAQNLLDQYETALENQQDRQ